MFSLFLSHLGKSRGHAPMCEMRMFIGTVEMRRKWMTIYGTNLMPQLGLSSQRRKLRPREVQ